MPYKMELSGNERNKIIGGDGDIEVCSRILVKKWEYKDISGESISDNKQFGQNNL